jgi:hypothetical protein
LTNLDQLVESIGEMIVKEVRDSVIQGQDKYIFKTPLESQNGKIRKKLESLPKESSDLLYKLIPGIVDGTIASFLHMFENNPNIKFIVIDSDGKEYDFVGLEAEIQGKLYGWAEKYTSERLSLLASDLENFE